MADSDLKTAALDSKNDFYDLLGIPSSASDSQIRTAYRRTALKYHPDKVGANNVEAREKFDLVQIANAILSDPAIRELYDNARRAREEKKEREAAFEGRRRAMKEDLERREAGGLKRKREEASEEEAFERELRRIAEDNRRRRREKEEELRREMLAQEQADANEEATNTTSPAVSTGPTEMERSVTIRYPASAARDKDSLIKLWERFGPIEDCILREKKVKKDGEKHRQLYVIAVLVYKSIVGAHAAVMDYPKIQTEEAWQDFEAVGWAGGKEPECVPKTNLSANSSKETGGAEEASDFARIMNDGEKKMPTFSFKGGPAKSSKSPSLDETTMMRLKNAEKRRQEQKAQREAAAAAAGQ